MREGHRNRERMLRWLVPFLFGKKMITKKKIGGGNILGVLR
jgi:hypothetical protein